MQEHVKQFIEDVNTTDSNESVFSPRSLTVQGPQLETLYPELFFANGVLPFRRGDNPGATFFSYYTYDQQGIAAARSTYAKDAPKVSVTGEEVIAKVLNFQASMDYNITELRADRMANRDLIGRKRRTLFNSFMRGLDKLVSEGDSEAGVTGVLNHPNVTTAIIPNGAGGNSEWSTKTAEEILADILSLISSMIDTSNGIHEISALIMPPAQYAKITAERIGPDTSETVLSFIKRTYPEIEILKSARLKNSLGGNADFIVGMDLSPDNFEVEITQDYEEFPVNQKDGIFDQSAHMRSAGLVLYRPLSIIRASGI